MTDRIASFVLHVCAFIPLFSLCSVVAAHNHESSSSGHDHGESSTGLNSASTVTVSAMLMAVLAFVANKAASL